MDGGRLKLLLIVATTVLASFTVVVASDPAPARAEYCYIDQNNSTICVPGSGPTAPAATVVLCDGWFTLVSGGFVIVPGQCGVPLEDGQRPTVWYCVSYAGSLKQADQCTAWRWSGNAAPTSLPPPTYSKRLSPGTVTAVSTGVSASATAVLTNLTMVDGAAAGYITADRCSSLVAGPQIKSNGNHGATTAIANLSVIPVGNDRNVCLYNQVGVNLLVDVQGFFAPPSTGGQGFTPLAPSRKLDTRNAPLARPPAGSITKVNTDVAAGTSAVLVNLTMVDGAAAGYITADRCSSLVAGPQTKSNGNHGATTAIANLAVVPVDADGSFCIYNQVAVNVVVDLQGAFSPAAPAGQLFSAAAGDRNLDTRNLPLGRPAAGSVTKVNTGVAAGTTAVLVNLTMVNGTSPGYITADSCTALTAGPQTKSSGNHAATTAIANLAVVPVDEDGSFCIYNQQPVDLVVDLQGSFSSTGTQQFFPVAPNRVLDTR